MESASDMADEPRPQLQKALTFSRFDSPRQPQHRSRASTITGSGVPDIILQNNYSSSPENEKQGRGEKRDIFSSEDADVDALGRTDGADTDVQKFEDLPIEIRSLTER